MIMRRLAQNLREQNWTAIAIEFVLLVAGVFLGIQVANWNAARQERALEADYLARLQRDFAAIDARLAANVSSWQRNTESSIRLLSDLDAFHRSGAWPRAKPEMLADVGNVMGGRIPAPRAASYVELLSAGKLGLLRDTRLRDALLDYDTQTGFATNAYDALVRRVDPFRGALVSKLHFDRRGDRASVDPDEVVRRNGSDWNDIDLAGFAADSGVETALSLFSNANYNQWLIARLQREKALAVVARLDAAAKSPEGGQR